MEDIWILPDKAFQVMADT